MQANRIRCVLMISAAVASRLSTSAGAALPVFAGPGAPNGQFSAVQSPYVTTTDHRAVTNAGIAIVSAYKDNDANQSLGERSYRWAPSVPFVQLASLQQPETVESVSYPNSVNLAGAVVGKARFFTDSSIVDHFQPVYWAANQTALTPLTLLQRRGDGYGEGDALSINDSGVAVGVSSKYGGADVTYRGVRWDSGTAAPIELQPINLSLNNATFTSNATQITNSGYILGSTSTYLLPSGSLGERVTRWMPGSTVGNHLFGLSSMPSGYQQSKGLDINASGRVVGNSMQFSGSTYVGDRAVRWFGDPTSAIHGAAVTALNPLTLTRTDTSYNAYDVALNDAGTSVGYQTEALTGSPYTLFNARSMRWDAATTAATELFAPAGFNAKSVFATDINNLGTIGGFVDQTPLYSTYSPPATTRAVLWLPGATTATFLNAFLNPLAPWTLQTVTSITDTGFVTGLGTYNYTPGGAASRAYTILVPQAGTYGKGDANFDTVVNFSDLIILAQHYNTVDASQPINVGDFNLDGHVNFDDLIVVAQNYNTSPAAALEAGGEAFAADWALAQSLVPEPTMLFAIGLLAITCRRK